MTKLLIGLACLVLGRLPGDFTLDQVLGYPYPSDLVAAATGSRIAWVLNERGHRNIWVAEAPEYRARRITRYLADDGQELTNLAFTPDGNTVIFVRGGDHDSNWPGDPPDPTSSPVAPKVEIWAIAAGGGEPRRIAEGDEPIVSPKGDRVVFTHEHQLWIAPIDGSAPAKLLLYARGTSTDPVWSSDGARLAFVSDRGDHSFIGVYTNDSTPIRWLAPATARDFMPQWSPDGAHLAFVRLPGQGGAPETLLDLHPAPWAIWTADASTGKGRMVWQSGDALRASFPETDGDANLHWAAGDRLVFLSEMDGWPHLYSMPAAGGTPTLLTPGAFMVEHVALSPDRRTIVYAANTGSDTNDVDRRHIFSVPVDHGAPRALTPGDGVEWTPVVTGDGQHIAFIGSHVSTPPLPEVVPTEGGTRVAIGAELIPSDFPSRQFVAPRKVVFHASDGLEIHGQLFEHPGGAAHKPAIVFVHGGPPRQMLLGWHYMDYYSHAYAINQYLAAHGYVVLSVNYRLGIGYGRDFQHPAHWGPWGESEYQDVKAGGEFLRSLSEVDSARIGIWGGSYGGLLTALALARNSDLFKTGVDLHGVHDWIGDLGTFLDGPLAKGHEQADIKQAMDVAWTSSPIADVAHWRSPVLLIQGDDDRNVHFHQTVDLARRLSAQGVRYQELVLPDEIHGFLRYASWMQADSALTDWFQRELAGGATVAQQDLRPGPQPPDAPAAWKRLIGDYGPPADSTPLIVFESGGQLFATKKGEEPRALTPEEAGRISLPHRDYVATTGSYIVHPPRPVAELRRDALRASPPAEAGPFRKPDLVDIARLNPAIHLDVRYATTNNFLQTPVYTEARAFMQRPAADALMRVLAKLKPLGYGLLIHDAYRPWFVTKIFWDATPPEGKIFVADPAQGSRHNRGCAVDLTLYDLKTGKPIEMTGTYDEMSPRSFPDYPGGTSLQRWHRDLLRAAMESEGYTVYEAEWWHFDYKDWREYPILNIPFEQLDVHRARSTQ
jgi:dipeptidyl aminopeptidase/acylaminoacyl peptidase/D-alanyl-D-alanine dipeptidase